MLRNKTFAPEFCSLISNWFDMREQAPGANLLHESVSGASFLVCTEICIHYFSKTKCRSTKRIAEQDSVAKISSILQEMKIDQKSDIRPFCAKAFNYYLSMNKRASQSSRRLTILDLPLPPSSLFFSSTFSKAPYACFFFQVFFIPCSPAGLEPLIFRMPPAY